MNWKLRYQYKLFNTHKWRCTERDTGVHEYTHTYIHTYVCMCVYIYVYINICIYIY